MNPAEVKSKREPYANEGPHDEPPPRGSARDSAASRDGAEDRNSCISSVREPWEEGPPPGRFDDAAPDLPPPDEAADRAKNAEKVIALVLESADLFHDMKQTTYAVIRLGTRRAVVKLGSRPMKSWIACQFRSAVGRSVATAAIDEALVTLDGIARFDREEQSLHVRVAAHNDAIYLDLGDDSGACIEVTSKGWRIVEEAPVHFRRPDSVRALPRPVGGGKLAELRDFVNLPDDDAHVLFVAWLVAAMRPDRPFPILALHGEQGTAKSTASRVARRLIDPNGAPVRSAPRSEDDLAVASQHSHVIAFDNLSGVQPWLSDALCRLATGGGLSKRTLYSDDDETVLEAIRPVIVNGIDDLANRADLAERCLVLTLQPMPKAKRRDEESFWRAFDAAAPRVLGVLLDGVASALCRLPETRVEDLPRMADFAKWSAAAEPGLGFAPGTILAAYERNRTRVVEVALDASPVAVAVRSLLDEPRHAGEWRGSPEQLLRALTDLVSEATKRSKTWPSNPRGISSALKRSATFLRTVGIEVDLDGHEGRGNDKRRIYRITKTRAGDTGPTGPAAPTRENMGDRPLDDVELERPRVRPHSMAAPAGDAPGTSVQRPPSPAGNGETVERERGDDGDGLAGSVRHEGRGTHDEHR